MQINARSSEDRYISCPIINMLLENQIKVQVQVETCNSSIALTTKNFNKSE